MRSNPNQYFKTPGYNRQSTYDIPVPFYDGSRDQFKPGSENSVRRDHPDISQGQPYPGVGDRYQGSNFRNLGPYPAYQPGAGGAGTGRCVFGLGSVSLGGRLN